MTGMDTGKVLGLRIDVDTHDGMKSGVPVLLDVFRESGVKGTFYLSMGPDNSGKAIFNVLRRPGFLGKMRRTGAARDAEGPGRRIAARPPRGSTACAPCSPGPCCPRG